MISRSLFKLYKKWGLNNQINQTSFPLFNKQGHINSKIHETPELTEVIQVLTRLKVKMKSTYSYKFLEPNKPHHILALNLILTYNNTDKKPKGSKIKKEKTYVPILSSSIHLLSAPHQNKHTLNSKNTK